MFFGLSKKGSNPHLFPKTLVYKEHVESTGRIFYNNDDLVKSHEFNYRWLGKKVHIPPPNHGGIKRRSIFSGTRLYM
jgi:hypothetical protein